MSQDRALARTYAIVEWGPFSDFRRFPFLFHCSSILLAIVMIQFERGKEIRETHHEGLVKGFSEKRLKIPLESSFKSRVLFDSYGPINNESDNKIFVFFATLENCFHRSPIPECENDRVRIFGKGNLLTGRGLEAIFQLELDSSPTTLSISIFGRRGQRGVRIQNESDSFPGIFGAKIQSLLILLLLLIESLPPPVPENFSRHREVGGHFDRRGTSRFSRTDTSHFLLQTVAPNRAKLTVIKINLPRALKFASFYAERIRGYL